MRKMKKSSVITILTICAALVWLSLNLYLIYSSLFNKPLEGIKKAPSAAAASKSSRQGLQLPAKIVPGEEVKIPFGKSVYLPDTTAVYILSESNWVGLFPGQTVYEKDQVKTSPSSKLDINMEGRKKIRLYENSEVELARSIFHDKNGSLPEANVISGRVSANSPAQFITGSGITITGNSEFIVEKRNKTTRVTVFNGIAQVTSAGRMVIVKKNQADIVEEGKQPEDPFDLPSAPLKIKLRTH